MDHNWPKVNLGEEVIVDPKAEKLYLEVTRLLEDLSDERNWTEHTVGGPDCCGEAYPSYEYYPIRDDPPWIDARKARAVFERYVEAVTKVRRPKNGT